MKIALYNGLIGHHEMLGHLYDYFLSLKLDFDVFAHNNIEHDIMDSSQQWESWYNNFFNINLTWKNPLEFNHTEYDLIILITDDDVTFKEEWLSICGEDKVICIVHNALRRRNHVLKHIGTRFFSLKPNLDWVLPCYLSIKPHEKKEIINKNNRIQVVCIGVQNVPPSPDFLIQLFNNFCDIDFHVVGRIINVDYTNFPNIYVHTKCHVEQMMELMKKSSHVLLINKPENNQPISNSMSGAIPLALSYNCQMIIPSLWQVYYNFKTSITYENTLTQNNNNNTRLTLSKTIPHDLINDELYAMIEQRNCIYDNILRKKQDDIFIMSEKQCNSWFTKVFNALHIEKINTFVETGTYLGDGIVNVKDHFRDIHSIELCKDFYDNANIQFTKDRHVTLHHGDSGEVLEKLIYNFKSPTLFYLDAHFSGGPTAFGKDNEKGIPLLRELTALGKRSQRDIIIIDDARLFGKCSTSGIPGNTMYPPTEFNWTHITVEAIIAAYGKYCHLYSCTDVDRYILFPIC